MKKMDKVLIVDDTEMNRSLLADMLSPQYAILEAADGLEAVTLLEKHHEDISIVLLDILMPEMDGFEVLDIMNKSGWIAKVPVIMISAETSPQSIDRAYSLGATDYINRPFDENIIQRRVMNTIMLYAKQRMMENMVAEQILEKERNNHFMVDVLSNAMEYRNGESGQHVLNIRIVTEMLLHQLVQSAKPYQLSAEEIGMIVNLSSLHDIGKISIPESILNKPGKLTPEEYEAMKAHTVVGDLILARATHQQNETMIRIARDICRWHHERYDGSGYPDGLKGAKIPISAQVVALADVYDALTNERVYKPAYSHEEAMQMILAGECGVFNPDLLQCLEEVSPYMQEAIRSGNSLNNSEIEVLQAGGRYLSGGQASSRTLNLLEQERITYRFFASMSKEIQFKYNLQTDILSFSEWGAQQLGLRELIVQPGENAELQQFFPKMAYLDLKARVYQTTPLNPVTSQIYLLNMHGDSRWYKVIVRTLWTDEENPEITGVIGKFMDIHEEYLELSSFKKLAGQDSLTKLRNHWTARNEIERLLKSRDSENYAMLLFDLDNFKSANDRYGHLFGDEVLKHVAHTVLKSIRSKDIAVRIGGDEFLVFLPYQSVIEPIVSRMFGLLTNSYRGFHISISLGIALCPEHGTDYESLFQCADRALYAAKKRGRKQYCFFDESIQDALSVLSPMDNELEGSLPDEVAESLLGGE